MFDCGNSRSREIKKEKHYSSSSSVSSYGSNDYNNLRVKYPSRKCIDSDTIRRLVDELRYSGRNEFNDDRHHSRHYDLVNCRKSPTKKAPKLKCVKESSITLDGGTSVTQYSDGPIIDLGTSSENTQAPSTSCITNVYSEPVCKNAVYSGADVDCDDKIIFDGGAA
jgi:hypothetical protein